MMEDDVVTILMLDGTEYRASLKPNGSEMTDLKPCPFCGAQLVASFVSEYGMHHPENDCLLSGKRVVTGYGYDNGNVDQVVWDEADAAAWNRRAAE